MGVALARLLVTDSASPLSVRGDAGTLHAVVRLATVAMDATPGHPSERAAVANRRPLKTRPVDASSVGCYGVTLATTNADMTSPLPTLPAGPAAEDCCAPSAGLDRILDADRIAAVARALAEPVRVHILDVLRRSDEDVCQCELIALFDIRQSLLSHHMRKLVDAGLVSIERRHKWAYYSVSHDALKELTSWLN